MLGLSKSPACLPLPSSKQQMDLLAASIDKLLRTHGTHLSTHAVHAAVRLARVDRRGTRGELQLRSLLRDLLDSLPNNEEGGGDDGEQGALLHQLELVRRQAETLLGLRIPLKKKKDATMINTANELVSKGSNKRASSPQAASSPHTRPPNKRRRTDLEDAQLLYNHFHPLDGSRPPPLARLIDQIPARQPSVATTASASPLSPASPSSPPPDLAHSHRSSIDGILDLTEAILPNNAAVRARYAQLAEALKPDRAKPDVDATPRAENHDDGGVTVRSRLSLLEELLDMLGRLCAPVRDEQVSLARDSLSGVRQAISLDEGQKKLRERWNSSLLLVERLLRDMLDDLSSFKQGHAQASILQANEDQLESATKERARTKEREAVEEIFGVDRVLSATREWCIALRPPTSPAAGISENLLTRASIMASLLSALFLPTPVSAPQLDRPLQETSPASSPPASTPNSAHNALPPIFMLSSRHIFLIQNKLQAMTILATLATIVPSGSQPSPVSTTTVSSAAAAAAPPAAAAATQSSSATSDWSTRVWALLLSEIDTPDNTSVDHIKLSNITDEVVRAMPEGKTSRQQIQQNVSRMLALNDPVFKLLSKRLEESLRDSLTRKLSHRIPKGFSIAPLPEVLRQVTADIDEIVSWAGAVWSIA